MNAALQQLFALVHLVGWGTLSGAVSSALIIPLLNRLLASSAWERTAVAVAWSVVMGFGTVYFAGQWNLADIATSLIAVIGSAQAVYHALVKPSGVAAALDARVAKATARRARTAGE